MPSNNTSTATTVETLVYSLRVGCSTLIVILCVVGVGGNTLSIYIYMKKSFRQRSINVLLTALSLADLLLLTLATPVFADMTFKNLFRVFPRIDVILYVYPVTMMLQSASVWLLVVITIERWAAVCRPLHVASYCTRKRAMCAIAVVTIMSIAYNLIRFWEYVKVTDEKGRQQLKSTIRANKAYMLWYQTVTTSVTQLIFPTLTLSVLSYCVARTIQNADEYRRRELLTLHQPREHRSAIMMCHVVFVFVVCYLCSFMLNIIEIVDKGLFKTSVGLLLNAINNVLVITNSASTFLIYLRYSTRYRAETRLLLLRLFAPQRYRQAVQQQQSLRTGLSAARCLVYQSYAATAVVRCSGQHTALLDDDVGGVGRAATPPPSTVPSDSGNAVAGHATPPPRQPRVGSRRVTPTTSTSGRRLTPETDDDSNDCAQKRRMSALFGRRPNCCRTLSDGGGRSLTGTDDQEDDAFDAEQHLSALCRSATATTIARRGGVSGGSGFETVVDRLVRLAMTPPPTLTRIDTTSSLSSTSVAEVTPRERVHFFL